MSKSRLILAALAGIALASPALGEPVSRAVRTDDLNLATPAGQARLHQRVRGAAQAVCDSGARDIASVARERRCFQLAMKSAEVQVATLVEKAVRTKS